MQNLALIITSLSEAVRRWFAGTDLTLLATQLALALVTGLIVS
jgi:hypothetical protein